MITFVKAQAAAMLGSVLDFLVTLLLAEGLHRGYILANLAGNITGAIIQFLLCRNWAFEAASGRVSMQMIRFILVWVGNFLLFAGALYVCVHGFKLHYLLAKTLISVLLGLTYQYFLQKHFVFRVPRPLGPAQ